MRKGIHPKSYEITIQMTNGEEFKTYSTKEMSKPLCAAYDKYNHPAWKGSVQSGNTGRIALFNEKFKGLSVAGLFNQSASAKADDSDSADK